MSKPKTKPISDPDVSIEVSAYPMKENIDVHEGNDDFVCLANVKITPHLTETHSPVDVVCVIDTSGSMSSAAKIKGDQSEGPTLSLLDVTKHAMKTVIEVLGQDDRISIVEFNSKAAVLLPLQYLTPKVKNSATNIINSMCPGGGTNLWDGLSTGLDQVQTTSQNFFKVGRHNRARHKAVLILTDGVPSAHCCPKIGYTEALKKKRRSDTIVHTFGFGYSLDSPLLKNIAITGQGMYSFIPDASFVGTAFINSLSNIKVTTSTNASVTLECSDSNYKQTVSIGSLQTGQSRDVVFKFVAERNHHADSSRIHNIKAHVSLSHLHECEKTTSLSSCAIRVDTRSVSVSTSVVAEWIRQSFSEMLYTLVDNYNQDSSKTKLQQFIASSKKLRDQYFTDSSQIDGLLADAEGQVAEAFSKLEWYNKWGRHFLPSLARAHAQQQCTNFKDPGLQIYGGKLFEDFRDAADDVFLSLPPPTPTSHFSTPLGWRSSSSAHMSQAPSVNMRAFHCSGNPCFHGACMVKMANGSLVQVQQIKKGDAVATPGNKSASVVCVVKTVCLNGTTDLVRVGHSGLQITPWHPVKETAQDQWVFPASLGSVEILPCDAVYSFVLDSCHIMQIGEVNCVTLGHNFQGDIVGHPFFGTDAVIHSLKSHQNGQSWSKGVVEFVGDCVVRNSNGLCIGFAHQFANDSSKHPAVE